MLLGLRSQHTLRFITVTFALAVLLVGVLHRDVFVHQILAIHVCDGVIGGSKSSRRRSRSLSRGRLIPRDLGQGDPGTETREGVVEDFFVDERVEIADEELRAHFDRFLLVCRGLV